MKTIKIIGLIILIGVVGCQKDGIKEDVPDCIREKILKFQKSDIICDSGASVIRFDFNGRHVYVFDPGNCGADMQAGIYDGQCEEVCALGGIIGNVTCEGVSFIENATNKTLIWEN